MSGQGNGGQLQLTNQGLGQYGGAAPAQPSYSGMMAYPGAQQGAYSPPLARGILPTMQQYATDGGWSPGAAGMSQNIGRIRDYGAPSAVVDPLAQQAGPGGLTMAQWRGYQNEGNPQAALHAQLAAMGNVRGNGVELGQPALTGQNARSQYYNNNGLGPAFRRPVVPAKPVGGNW